jgi:hypothetical protein
MRKRVNLAVNVWGSVNSAETRESVLSINVHGARPTDTLSARPPEGECGVNFVFDFDQRVEHLWGSGFRAALENGGKRSLP